MCLVAHLPNNVSIAVVNITRFSNASRCSLSTNENKTQCPCKVSLTVKFNLPGLSKLLSPGETIKVTEESKKQESFIKY